MKKNALLFCLVFVSISCPLISFSQGEFPNDAIGYRFVLSDYLKLYLVALFIFIGVWVLLRPVVWWYYGTKETHRLLSEILAELKKGDAEKVADKELIDFLKSKGSRD